MTKVRFALVAFVAALTLVGTGLALLPEADAPDHGAAVPGQAAVPAMPVLPAYRTYHLRIFDESGQLVWTSWPGENGTLAAQNQTAGSLAEGGSPLNATWEQYPSTLAPVLSAIRDGPPGAVLTLPHVRLDKPLPDRITINNTVRMPVAGVVSEADAERLFAGAFRGLTVRFMGFVPVQITDIDGAGVHYRMLLNETVSRAVPRTSGLFLEGATDGSDAIFRLSAPEGAFRVHAPCEFAPYAVLPAGTYQVAEQEGPILSADRYASGFDYALGGSTVSLEITYLD